MNGVVMRVGLRSILCLCGALLAGPTAAAEMQDGALGTVRVIPPHGQAAGVVALISDGSGFDADENALADAFVARGQLVVGVSWRGWSRRGGAARHGDCADLLGPLLGVVARAERDAGMRTYFTPVLAGLGEGGSAVRALTPAVASHQIGGVVALKADVMLRSDAPLCGSIAHPRGGGFVYEGPSRSTPGALRAFPDLAVADAADAVQSLEAQAGPRGPGELADLPVVVTRPPGSAHRLAVLLTGDGGLDGLDQDLANALAGRGTIVATLDSRRYFWSKRDPDTLAADLQRIVRHFRRESPVRSLALVGYSFGADVLPLAYARLPQPIRGDIGVVSLISLAPAIDFQIEFDDRDYPNAVPLLPAAARIDAPAVQCLYGEDDQPAALACPALGHVRPSIAVHRSAGGHGLDGDMERVADIIVAPLAMAEATNGRQGRAWLRRVAPPTAAATLASAPVKIRPVR